MIWIVLGMHKSGTTLISRMLHISGISMIDDCDNIGDYDTGNKMERLSTKNINNLILSSHGKFSLDIQDNSCLLADNSSRDLTIKARDFCSQLGTDWGFKDPRTCLTYDEWSTALTDHSIIAIFRSPDEVWSHYWASARFLRKLTVFFKFIGAWNKYNSSIISILERNCRPYIAIEYSALMSSDRELIRLQTFVKTKIIDCRESRLYRAKTAGRFYFFLACFIHKLKGGTSPHLIYSKLLQLSKTDLQ